MSKPISDCRSCIHLNQRLNLISALPRIHDCTAPERAGDRKSVNGYCVYYIREPGSDDYIGGEISLDKS